MLLAEDSHGSGPCVCFPVRTGYPRLRAPQSFVLLRRRLSWTNGAITLIAKQPAEAHIPEIVRERLPLWALSANHVPWEGDVTVCGSPRLDSAVMLSFPFKGTLRFPTAESSRELSPFGLDSLERGLPCMGSSARTSCTRLGCIQLGSCKHLSSPAAKC